MSHYAQLEIDDEEEATAVGNPVRRASVWWAQTKKANPRLRLALDIASIVFFIVKVVWAIYLSVIVHQYYDKIQSMERQLAAAQENVRHASATALTVEAKFATMR